ncbi:MAG: metallophosphoesterase [Mollicutes bacterium]|nr:metallophosphoesterase [Mollicutes bacterium]MDD7264423.1 metallophosphoesterase [bacterium]MDY4979367.1 metallophosphoesterase [Candidatus Onthovivens sp.]
MIYNLNKNIVKTMFFSSALLSLVSCKEEKNLSNLLVQGEISKYEYLVGESINFDDLKVYDKLTRKEIENYNIYLNDIVTNNKSYTFLDVGSYTLSIQKENYNPYIFNNKINVISNNEKLLHLDYSNTKTKYNLNDKFYYSDISLYDESNNKINNFTVNISDGYQLTNLGNFEVVINYKDYKELTYNIEVIDSKTNYLKVLRKPNKVYYELNDKLDLTGLKVIDLNTNQEITDYKVSINNNDILNKLGKIDIKISKDSYIDTNLEIEVVEPYNEGSVRTIDIYTVNDTHGAFTRREDLTLKQAGMSYIGDYYQNKKSVDSLFLSAGDMWQGGIESNNTKGLIMTDALNLIGCDAMSIGNHEFDWDEAQILKNKEIMEFPLLASNIFYKDTNVIPSYLDKSVTIDRAGVKIGIIGSVAENLGSSIITSIAKKFTFPNPLQYIKDESDKLRNEGCDLVILLCHDEGYELKSETEPSKFYDLTTISNVSNKRYVDAMVFGHDHVSKQGIYNNVPFVEARCNGAFIGNIKIDIKKSGEDYYVLNNSESNVINAFYNATSSMKSIEDLLFKYQDLIGDTNKVIYNFKNYYTRDQFAYIVCQAIVWFINNNKISFDNKEINIGAHNLQGIRSDVNAGEFKEEDLTKVCPFSNCISIIKCNDSQLKYLNNSSNAVYYLNSNPIKDSDGYYYVGTISYVAEYTNKNGASSWTSFKEYDDFFIGNVLREFLLNNSELNL